MQPTRWPRIVSALLIVGLGVFPLLGQTENEAPPPENPPAATAPAEHAEPQGESEKSALERQQEMAARYRQFDATLQKMADYLRETDPAKADIIIRAIRLSRENRVSDQMSRVVQLLENEQFGVASERQDDVLASMQALLKLLQSEGILDNNRAEQERIKDLLKDLGKILGKEKDLRAKTERGEDANRLADAQAKVAQETKDLENKIDGQDASKNAGKPGESKPGESKPGESKPGESKPGESKPGESKPGEKKPGESKPGESKPGEKKPGEQKPGEKKPGEQKPGEKKPGESKPGESKPGESKPGESKPGESKPGESKPGQPKPGQPKPGESKPGEQKPQEPQESQEDNRNKRTPGREDIERARDEMERAIEELKKKNHDGASKAQDEAIKNLIAAKEKLEEILRQLRDEERELLLLALEARFQKMLAMQKLVYQGTVDLARIDAAAWVDRHTQQSQQLSRDENEIAIDAQKALTLLKEEGSSVAFPEAVEQLREDMLTVARRLDENEVGEITQAIERDIIEGLAEAIEALKKELEKLKEKKKNPPPPNSGEPPEPPLVDILAELKMLRSLQLRVNRMTKQFGRMIDGPDGEQALKQDVLDQLRRLAVRQGRIQQATYNLATGKNK